MAEGFGPRIAGQLGEGFIDIDNPPARVGDHDAFVRIVKNAGRQFLPLFGLQAFADVLGNTQNGGLAVPVAFNNAGFRHELATVGPAQRQ
ncbi:MAG: hypothetical protein ACD_10C00761G0001 [uncultured bacterium]|nr:MAG: hypothetical protein ACD_10C00761G0001 [uncultured bacterium]